MRSDVSVLAALSAALGAVSLVLLWRAALAGQAPPGSRRLLWASTIFYLLWVVLTIVGVLAHRRVS